MYLLQKHDSSLATATRQSENVERDHDQEDDEQCDDHQDRHDG